MEAAGQEPGDAAALLGEAGQQHLLEHAATLGPAGETFLRAAARWPWKELRALLESAPSEGAPLLRPPPGLTWRRQQAEGGLRDRLARLGGAYLSQRPVAALLLAGGQGSRLGVSGAKGNVCFGPEENRTLYRIHAERHLATCRASGRPHPLLVLTNPETVEDTQSAFQREHFFGLDRSQVSFLVQEMLPVLDPSGRGLLAAPGELCLAPDGHGGALLTLGRQGTLDALSDRGIEILATYQVDNPLARPLDPVALGWMLERRLELATKVVRKREAAEPVGIAARDGKGGLRIVEYSELSEQQAADPTLQLGSIALHLFSVGFLRRVLATEASLPLHRAQKRVVHWDPARGRVQPQEANAWKFERFLFDVFPAARRAEVVEILRAWEFAPVKSETGTDSLEAARAQVAAEVERWRRERGLPASPVVSLRPLELDGP